MCKVEITYIVLGISALNERIKIIYDRIAPKDPIRLMTALALLRKGLGVTSGIKDTAGVRYIAITNKTTKSKAIKLIK